MKIIQYVMTIIVFSLFMIFYTIETKAANFVVGDALTFQNALTEAQSNQDDDTIMLLPGTYLVTKPLSYYAPEPPWAQPENHSIAIEGTDVDTTILDGSSVSEILWIDTSNVEEGIVISISVKNITFKNVSVDTSANSGVGLSVLSRDGNISVDNCKFINNGGGGAELLSMRGMITVTNSMFNDNCCAYQGSGLFMSTAGMINLEGCEFAGNNSGSEGGGAYCGVSESTTITISDNSFKNNHATSTGAGLEVYVPKGGQILLKNNSFEDNHVGDRGGGVFIESVDLENIATIMLTQNSFTANSALHGAGAYVSSEKSQIVISYSTFKHNNAGGGEGGGVYAYAKNSGGIFVNNIFGENNATYGGGLYAKTDNGDITITNNTSEGNTVDEDGGGVYVHLQDNGTKADVYNNIIWDNTAENSGGDVYIDDDGDADSIGAEVNFYSNDYHILGAMLGTNLMKFNNIVEDPLTTEDYHLQTDSPCIDAGDNSAPQLPEKDMDFTDRIIDGDENGDALVDIGADEYDPSSPPATTTTTTTTSIPSQPCAIETLYGENADEVVILRSFRDEILSKIPEGKKIIAMYYKWNFTIAETMKKNRVFKQEIKHIVDKIVSFINWFVSLDKNTCLKK